VLLENCRREKEKIQNKVKSLRSAMLEHIATGHTRYFLYVYTYLSLYLYLSSARSRGEKKYVVMMEDLNAVLHDLKGGGRSDKASRLPMIPSPVQAQLFYESGGSSLRIKEARIYSHVPTCITRFLLQ
jgi:hypothetical protein